MNPEKWKNIPSCVVNAFKMVIESAMDDSLVFMSIHSKLEELHTDVNQHFKKIEKDIIRRHENITQMNERFEASLEKKMGHQMTEVERITNIQSVEMDKAQKEVFTTLQKVNLKMDQVTKLLAMKEWIKTTMTSLENRLTVKFSESILETKETIVHENEHAIGVNNENIMDHIKYIKEDLNVKVQNIETKMEQQITDIHSLSNSNIDNIVEQLKESISQLQLQLNDKVSILSNTNSQCEDQIS